MSTSKKKPWSSYRPSPGRKFEIGDRVTIQFNEAPGHRRTPVYIRGKTGVIERVCGAFRNPEERAYGFDGLPVPSPDGNRLAWTSSRGGGRAGQLYLADWNHDRALTALLAAPNR